jgi:hypothetical protein
MEESNCVASNVSPIEGLFMRESLFMVNIFYIQDCPENSIVKLIQIFRIKFNQLWDRFQIIRILSSKN